MSVCCCQSSGSESNPSGGEAERASIKEAGGLERGRDGGGEREREMEKEREMDKDRERWRKMDRVLHMSDV